MFAKRDSHRLKLRVLKAIIIKVFVAPKAAVVQLKFHQLNLNRDCFQVYADVVIIWMKAHQVEFIPSTRILLQ